MTPAPLTAYVAYIPASRLDRHHIAAFLDLPPAAGARAVAAFDEDTTTLAVEAARQLPDIAASSRPLFFGTALPAYADKTNAAAIHAALGLADQAFVADLTSSPRSGLAALRAAADAAGLAVMADIRTGLPGSADERDGGDAAAAFLFGDADPIAHVLARRARTVELLDRWRLPGERAARAWEDRFVADHYLPLALAVAREALAEAHLDRVDHMIVSTSSARLTRTIQTQLGNSGASDLFDEVGWAGAADAGLLLAGVLDRAGANETILLVSVADGADAWVFRTTALLASRRAPRAIRDQLGARVPVSYARVLTWRGHLDRAAPRRPDPVSPAAPPSAREREWKFGLVGSRCDACGAVHAPPSRVCRACRAVDRMVPHHLAGCEATVAACTIDRLAFSPSPPMTIATIDFDRGGRLECEVTDVGPDGVHVGDRVQMTFRRLFTSAGVHNYFWKARPSPRRNDGE